MDQTIPGPQSPNQYKSEYTTEKDKVQPAFSDGYELAPAQRLYSQNMFRNCGFPLFVKQISRFSSRHAIHFAHGSSRQTASEGTVSFDCHRRRWAGAAARMHAQLCADETGSMYAQTALPVPEIEFPGPQTHGILPHTHSGSSFSKRLCVISLDHSRAELRASECRWPAAPASPEPGDLRDGRQTPA